MAAPIGRHVGVGTEAMRDPMVDLLFVSVLLISYRLHVLATSLTPSAFDLLIHFVTTFG